MKTSTESANSKESLPKVGVKRSADDISDAGGKTQGNAESSVKIPKTDSDAAVKTSKTDDKTVVKNEPKEPAEISKSRNDEKQETELSKIALPTTTAISKDNKPATTNIPVTNGTKTSTGGTSSKTNRDNLSEKKLRRLEKNRLSARQCRKRKKLEAQKLEKEIKRMEGENLRLRLQLQIGEEAEESAAQEQDRVTEILDALLKGGSSESEVYSTLEEFKDKFADYGSERRSAIEFHFRNVQRLLMPTSITSVTMSVLKGDLTKNANPMKSASNKNNQSDSTPQRKLEEAMNDPSNAKVPPSQKALFSQIVDVLEVTPQQAAALKDSRWVAKELDQALAQSLKVLDELRQSFTQCGEDLEKEFGVIRSILTPTQTAKFLIWVAKNGACMHMLNELWSKTYSTPPSSKIHHVPTDRRIGVTGTSSKGNLPPIGIANGQNSFVRKVENQILMMPAKQPVPISRAPVLKPPISTINLAAPASTSLNVHSIATIPIPEPTPVRNFQPMVNNTPLSIPTVQNIARLPIHVATRPNASGLVLGSTMTSQITSSPIPLPASSIPHINRTMPIPQSNHNLARMSSPPLRPPGNINVPQIVPIPVSSALPPAPSPVPMPTPGPRNPIPMPTPSTLPMSTNVPGPVAMSKPVAPPGLLPAPMSVPSPMPLPMHSPMPIPGLLPTSTNMPSSTPEQKVPKSSPVPSNISVPTNISPPAPTIPTASRLAPLHASNPSPMASPTPGFITTTTKPLVPLHVPLSAPGTLPATTKSSVPAPTLRIPPVNSSVSARQHARSPSPIPEPTPASAPTPNPTPAPFPIPGSSCSNPNVQSKLISAPSLAPLHVSSPTPVPIPNPIPSQAPIPVSAPLPPLASINAPSSAPAPKSFNLSDSNVAPNPVPAPLPPLTLVSPSTTAPPSMQASPKASVPQAAPKIKAASKPPSPDTTIPVSNLVSSEAIAVEQTSNSTVKKSPDQEANLSENS